ncbi:hypothetical protein, partial [Paraburkholderia sediminicola]|uniref:hypothetical protein n=1 Tax=Paraburkholderia sediminicola TaxID=458836 RepID=UPI0038BDE072
QGKANTLRTLTKAPRRKKANQTPTAAGTQRKPHIFRQIKQRVSPPLRSKEKQAVNTVSNKPLAASEKSERAPTLTDHLAKAKAKSPLL